MSNVSIFRLAITLLLATTLLGCISAKPVETQSAIDDRPLVFFVSSNTSSIDGLSIYVDGLHMGEASQFVNIKKGLAILPGTHLIEVRRNNNIIISEKVYVGSGTSKTIPIDAR